MLDEKLFMWAFKEMAAEVHQNARDHGFWEGDRNDGEAIALMHSELSEALEGLRRAKADDHLPLRSSVEVELADCIIRIMDLSYARGWDVAGAIVDKARYNRGRPHKHGKGF